jgi:hypothetical protein
MALMCIAIETIVLARLFWLQSYELNALLEFKKKKFVREWINIC